MRPHPNHDVTAEDIETMHSHGAIETLREWCSWNDPNGNFDEWESGADEGQPIDDIDWLRDVALDMLSNA